MKSIRTKAASISANEIAAVAAQGVARAQAARRAASDAQARKAAGEELSAEQIDQVSGAALSLAMKPWLIYGGPWLGDMYGLGGYGVPVDQSIGAKTLIG